MTDTKKNYFYNLVLNLSNILFSIVLIPYVSRILGSEPIGVYSFTYSIVSYFLLFSLLGIKNYGNRIIAEFKDKKEEKSKQFLSLYALQIISSLIMLSLYLGYVYLICKENKLVALAQCIYLLSAVFDITWFFNGNQEFKPALLIGTLSKFIYFLFIMIFIKGPQNIVLYVIIVGAYSVLNNILFFPLLKNKISFVSFKKEDILKHLKPCLVLFIPVLSVSLYKIMDKIMLGFISNTLEVGYYEQAEKIINIPLQFISVLGTVMFPKMSNLVVNGKEKAIKKYIDMSIKFIMFLIIPMALGLICVAKDFIPLFLGIEFIKSSVLLHGLAISIIFVAWGSVIRLHYIIPKKMDGVFVNSVSLGAVVNILFNFMLIRNFKSIGAVIATIVAEFVVAFYQTLAVRKELPISDYLSSTGIILLKGIIMSLFVLSIDLLKIPNLYIKLLIQITIGVLVYALLNKKYIKSLLVDFKFKNK